MNEYRSLTVHLAGTYYFNRVEIQRDTGTRAYRPGIYSIKRVQRLFDQATRVYPDILDSTIEMTAIRNRQRELD